VFVGDVLVIDKVEGKVGDIFELVLFLLVDGDIVMSDVVKFVKVKVIVELVFFEKGLKIVIMKFKNKIGYCKC